MTILRSAVRAWTSFLPILSLAACGGDDLPEPGDSLGNRGAPDGGADGEVEEGPLQGACPQGFAPSEGENAGFPSDGEERTFHVMLPDDTTSPRPLFVSLTGTVQRELDFAAQSELDRLPESGWIVVVPVRTCSQHGTNCNRMGRDGRIWEPWYDGEYSPQEDPGPDARFVESMVRCIADAWPVDSRRIYVGGISAGGSFTNRLMTYNSELFAGGVPASGNWYDGQVMPPSPRAMDPRIVIVIWGGPGDVWPPGSPVVDYEVDTRQASEHYAAQENVVTVSCSGTHGHVWPTAMTPWIAETLLSHPKGTDPAAFALTDPPAGFACVLGEYTDR